MKLLCLWVHIIICLVQYQIGFPHLVNNNTSKSHLCHEEERQWLFQLKQLVPPPEFLPYRQLCDGRPANHSKVMHWKQRRDCCLWDGVTCHESTGHVIGLDLSCSALTGNIHSNSTLFRLTHLQNLNLAHNDFDATEISFQFGQLNSLTHLNLSHYGFYGRIPAEFYHLSNLVSLDMTSNEGISPDIKTLFGNMTKLRVVLLGGVNISSVLPVNMSSFLTRLDLEDTGVHGILPVSIFEKPNLQFLDLSHNDGLTGSLPSFNISNVRLIEQLVLRETSISGRLPDSIGFMTNLNSLSLSYSKFSGPIPESIGNLTELAEMDFSRNEFSGQVPSTIANLRELTHLDLSENHLRGQLPDAFSEIQKLTSLYLGGNGFSGIMPPSLFTNTSQLKELNISLNALTGQLPSSLTNMSRLQTIDISSNKLMGPFPSAAGDGLQNLSRLYLSDNSIQGTVPSWLFRLPSLQRLDLSSNRLVILLESFYIQSQIQRVSLSHNTITQHSRHKVLNVSLPNLEMLDFSSCEIKEFPNLLRNLSGLTWLGLSNNKIHGPIPSWFGSLPLTYLNLSANYLTEAPWKQLGNLNVLDLHSNSLQDTFPSSICNMTQLHILDLSSNKLRGTIPECIANFGFDLKVLDLRRNELHGNIPTTFRLSSLVTLALNGNHLEGPLPRSLASCLELQVVDVGNNMIQDTFPSWLENTSLIVLILKSNRFHGPISPPGSNNSFVYLQIVDLSYNNFSGPLPEKLFTTLQAMKKHVELVSIKDIYLATDSYQSSMTLSVKGAVVEFTRVLRFFTTIDLSSNNFHGHIPESITDLILLRLLNLSHNNFSGSIPRALGSMKELEQLDLSSNQLRGGIPQTLTNLTFLAVLNLSYNHLVGPIPKGNQFQTFSNESYIGNSGLCGDPLTTSCEPPSPGIFEEEDEDEDEDEDDGFMTGFTWKTVVIGYSCGILFGFILGNVMISTQKPKWLTRFVYTEAAIILKRRKRRAVRMVLLRTR